MSKVTPVLEQLDNFNNILKLLQAGKFRGDIQTDVAQTEQQLFSPADVARALKTKLASFRFLLLDVDAEPEHCSELLQVTLQILFQLWNSLETACDGETQFMRRGFELAFANMCVQMQNMVDLAKDQIIKRKNKKRQNSNQSSNTSNISVGLVFQCCEAIINMPASSIEFSSTATKNAMSKLNDAGKELLVIKDKAQKRSENLKIKLIEKMNIDEDEDEEDDLDDVFDAFGDSDDWGSEQDDEEDIKNKKEKEKKKEKDKFRVKDKSQIKDADRKRQKDLERVNQHNNEELLDNALRLVKISGSITLNLHKFLENIKNKKKITRQEKSKEFGQDQQQSIEQNHLILIGNQSTLQNSKDNEEKLNQQDLKQQNIQEQLQNSKINQQSSFQSSSTSQASQSTIIPPFLTSLDDLTPMVEQLSSTADALCEHFYFREDCSDDLIDISHTIHKVIQEIGNMVNTLEYEKETEQTSIQIKKDEKESNTSQNLSLNHPTRWIPLVIDMHRRCIADISSIFERQGKKDNVRRINNNQQQTEDQGSKENKTKQ